MNMKRIEKVKRIIIHHSLTEDGKTVSWGAIRRYHIKVRGWQEIGYHYGIENINGDYYCLIGRPDIYVGAHTKGHNEDSIGICFVGNYDKDYPTVEMLWVASKLIIVPLLQKFELTVNDIYGHRDFNPHKTCPGKNFDLNFLKRIVEDLL